MKSVYLFLVFATITFLVGLGRGGKEWVSRMTGVEDLKKPQIHYLSVQEDSGT